MDASTLIILIAPNVSQQMGGEGIKALQTFKYFKQAHPRTIQITHERNRAHIQNDLALEDVFYVDDDFQSLLIWRSVVLRGFLGIWFFKKAVKLAEALAEQKGCAAKQVIIHQTGPNSPILPRHISDKHLNSFGPINGNIHYPRAFYFRENIQYKAKRLLHDSFQRLNALLFKQLRQSDMIFAAGGERTTQSLMLAGCDASKIVETIDCGIEDVYLTLPRIQHHYENLRFVHFGRLVNFKGTDLVIRALAKSRLPIQLDIIGDGPELEKCLALVNALGLSDRVQFLPWRSHQDLLNSLSDYRGFVLPSLADSNGIVVQESMALGLPVIALDWGGPTLLIDHLVDGYLVPVDDEASIVANFAAAMDDLAHNAHRAEKISRAARQKAQDWKWSAVANIWLTHLSRICVTNNGETAKYTKTTVLKDKAA